METGLGVSCPTCGVVCANLRGLATHRNSSIDRKCFEEWKLKEEERERNRGVRIKCRVCGAELRSITNTHLKTHGITQNKYKEMFPDATIFSEELLRIQRDRREKTLKERYTPEELREIKGMKGVKTKEEKYGKPYSELCREWSVTAWDSPERKQEQGAKIRKYFDSIRIDPEKHAQHKKRRAEKRKKTCLEKYGTEFAQQSEIVKERVRNNIIKRHGSLLEYYRKTARAGVRTRMEKYGELHFCPVYSIRSQELFSSIERALFFHNMTIFYATNGQKKKTNEFVVPVRNSTVGSRFLDFYVLELNKAIEFDEDYHSSEKQLILDKEREQEIRNNLPGVQIMRITDEEWSSNKLLATRKCVDWLLK